MTEKGTTGTILQELNVLSILHKPTEPQKFRLRCPTETEVTYAILKFLITSFKK